MSLFRVTPDSPFTGPHQNQPVVQYGDSDAKKAMIMVHGRGATAQSILPLSQEFQTQHMKFLAPQANHHTWYPYSFLSPIEMNEPGISSGLQAIGSIVHNLEEEGISSNNIFLLGFSQGACLASEFVARHPKPYGGLFVLSGGVIGPEVHPHAYRGDLEKTPVFLGCSDIDPHIPKERVNASARLFETLGAHVIKKLYPNMGHLVNEDEIHHIQQILNS
ncbi:MAG: phospholipase [Bacteroidota bacterium]